MVNEAVCLFAVVTGFRPLFVSKSGDSWTIREQKD